VYFRIIGPWTVFQGRIWRLPGAEAAGLVVYCTLIVIVIGGAGFVARRNYRLGKGDMQGAPRLAAVMLLCSFLCWALRRITFRP
jgi:hypothetical protein